MSGNSGKITYDLNGNLLKMLHKGVVPGNTAPVTTDDLTYSYTLSNKLNKVTDAMPLSALNGKFGDFKDGANGSANDYVYDNNGNVIVDLNKSIQSAGGGAPGTKGVIYNFLDKPELIRITGRGTVRIVYSADGNVLQRAFIPESGTSAITTTINEFVYQETSATLTASTVAPFSGSGLALSSILFEEGRIRVITPTSTGNGFDALVISGNLTLPNSKEGVYDYYIRDYQENVRMILTEENYTAYNTATMETGRASVETPVFGQSGAANEVTTTRYARPSGWTNNSTDYVSRIGNLAGKTVGPNTLQKVMAGDKVSAEVKYYFTGAPGGGSSGMLANVLGSLIASIGSSGATGSLVKDGVSGINTALTNTPGFVNTVSPTGNPSAPQAYLTIMFFDERFNFISAADGGVSQAQVNATWSTSTAPLALGTVKAPKNGYVYVYISNRSDQHVYFDDFKVAITAGNIIEENHYYSFGLKIAAISSKKLGHVNEGVLKNDYLYNDKELFDDGELNWYNYGFRNYDPQIWRFPQLDPLTDYYAVLTSYQYADNDPIANVDLDGLEPLSSIGGAVSGAARDFTYAYNTASMVLGPAMHVATASSTVFTTINLVTSITSLVAIGANIASDIINNKSVTQQVGGQLIGIRNRPRYGQGADFMSENPPAGLPANNRKNWALNDNYDDNKLFNNMHELFDFYSSGALKGVGKDMVNAFRQGVDGEYSNPLLNKAIQSNVESRRFAIEFTKLFHEKIKKSNGKIDFAPIAFDGSPNYNETFSGLGITIHGTQGARVYLLKYTFYPETQKYHATFRVDLYDDFGVSLEDVTSKWYAPHYNGLMAWWILQHRRGYRPFVTKLSFTFTTSQSLK
ncbi:MAG TPA: DUF3289 family protein [Agriterribacter sp.]|nr:DUF3289 family protein [Agriterribacter sp.]